MKSAEWIKCKKVGGKEPIRAYQEVGTSYICLLSNFPTFRKFGDKMLKVWKNGKLERDCGRRSIHLVERCMWVALKLRCEGSLGNPGRAR